MTKYFGKFVTVVKCKKLGMPGQGFHHKRESWCRANVGDKRIDWDYYSQGNSYVFVKPEDATLFRLMFGL